MLTLVPFLVAIVGVLVLPGNGENLDRYFRMWLVLVLACGAPGALARCPRCRRWFHLSGGWVSPWNSACLHCGFGEGL